MRIGITSITLTRSGGIGKYVAELSARFAKENEVHIITPKVECEIPGATIHKTRIIWSPMSMQVATGAITNTLAGRRLKEEGIIDVFHSQGAEAIGSDVVTAHSCQKAAVEKLREARGGIYRMLKPFEPRSNIVLAIERRNFGDRRCKKAISVSEGVKREICDIYKYPEDDIAVIPPGVDLEEFKPENKSLYRGKVRGGLGLSDEDFVLLFMGWEFKRKGLQHVIDALPKTRNDVKLLVVGGDNPAPYLAAAEKLGVRDRVIFTGKVPEVRQYYAASDLFVFPTVYEAFSAVTLEAAATGIPILSTRVNGTEELISDGLNGFFVEPTGEDIADKIKGVMGRGAGWMGEEARKSVKDYSWDKIADRVLDAYRVAVK